MKITLNYRVSVTFDIAPSDIVDALDPDATPAQIAESVDDSISEAAAERFPTYTVHGRDELLAKVAELLKAVP